MILNPGAEGVVAGCLSRQRHMIPPLLFLPSACSVKDESSMEKYLHSVSLGSGTSKSLPMLADKQKKGCKQAGEFEVWFGGRSAHAL